jgi:hypothetical protein
LDGKRRLGRIPIETMPKLKASFQSLGKMMEDVRLMLGLSQEEAVHLLSLLEKADFGSLHFFRGNINIKFDKILPEGKYSKIRLTVNIEDGDIRSTNVYTVPRAFVRLAKRKS